MTIRNDLTINWSLSPRIIEVAAPSDTLTNQDLYDTIRDKAATISGIDEPDIIDGSGKESLGGNAYVGLTIKLINAKVKFEQRGTPTTCNISGGNLVAVDANGTAIFPIEPSTNVTVQLAQSSSATIAESDTVPIAQQLTITHGAGNWANKRGIFK